MLARSLSQSFCTQSGTLSSRLFGPAISTYGKSLPTSGGVRCILGSPLTVPLLFWSIARRSKWLLTGRRWFAARRVLWRGKELATFARGFLFAVNVFAKRAGPSPPRCAFVRRLLARLASRASCSAWSIASLALASSWGEGYGVERADGMGGL